MMGGVEFAIILFVGVLKPVVEIVPEFLHHVHGVSGLPPTPSLAAVPLLTPPLLIKSTVHGRSIT
jgi:hypothetical protein